MSRINTDDPKFFDWWRANYDNLTHEENIEIGNQLEEKYPYQGSYNFEHLLRIFGDPKKPFGAKLYNMSVLEIGGWKGELACSCLQQWPQAISGWTNIDMCKAAVDKGLKHEKLIHVFPGHFDWFKNPRTTNFDICISTHTIEHLSDEHLVQLIEHIKGIPIVMFEAPIGDGESNWDGYHGTHILKMGWAKINNLMLRNKYFVRKLSDWSYLYELNTNKVLTT